MNAYGIAVKRYIPSSEVIRRHLSFEKYCMAEISRLTINMVDSVSREELLYWQLKRDSKQELLDEAIEEYTQWSFED